MNARSSRLLVLSLLTVAAASGCVAYPDGTVAFLPPPPPIVIAQAPVVAVAPAPVYVSRPVVYARSYYRPRYIRTYWGGYRTGYYYRGGCW